MILVMFDIDGTLVDSVESNGQLYLDAVQTVVGRKIDSNWSSYRNVTDSGILEEILEHKDFLDNRQLLTARIKKLLLKSFTRHVESNRTAISEIPGARLLIETLLSKPEVRVAIATGGWEEMSLLKLRSIGLKPENLAMATSSDAVRRTVIMKIAEQRALSGATTAKKYYFGDAIWDKIACEDLGYEFIAVGRAVDHGVVFEDLRELNKVLECLEV